MKKEITENNGAIKISDEVIATIASVAVNETNGVFGLSSSIAGEIASKFSKKNIGKGIKVTTTETGTTIDLSVVMQYGYKIPEVAWEVQENVKKSVESMSGLEVEKVNIHVADINFDSDSCTAEVVSE